ncbi:MAG: hypothetical protein ACRDZV_12825 [Acidimicrobiia bacterium]
MSDPGTPTSQTPTSQKPEAAETITTSRQPSLPLVGGFIVIVALGVIAWLIFVSGLLESGDAEPTPSPSISPSASASVEPSGEPSPSPTPEPTEAPTVTPEPSAEAGPIEVAWTAASGIDRLAQVHDIAYLDGRWVAAGGDFAEESFTAAIWTSDDGMTWTPSEIDSTRGANEYTQVGAVVEIDGTLVAIGSWGVVPSDQVSWMTWRSTDGGATWTETREVDTALHAIANGEAGLVAAGWTYGGATPFDSYFATSADGITWERTAATLPKAQVQDLGVIGDRIVAVGHVWVEPQLDLDAAAWYSDDGGTSWTVADVPDGGMSTSMGDVVPFGDGLAAIGGEGTVSAWVTSDGETWERFDVADGAFSSALGAVDGGLVAVGNGFGQDLGPGVSWTSPDAAAWQAGGSLGMVPVRLSAVAGNGDVVVVGGGCEGGCETVIWVGEVSR